MPTLRLRMVLLGLGISAAVVSLGACSGTEAPVAPVAPPPPPPPPPTEPVVASVTVAPAAASIVVGATVQLTATVRDAEGHELTGHVVTWSSDASAVASVSPTGLVTGMSACLATITARSEGKQGAAAITVAAAAGSGAATGGGTPACGFTSASTDALLFTGRVSHRQ